MPWPRSAGFSTLPFSSSLAVGHLETSRIELQTNKKKAFVNRDRGLGSTVQTYAPAHRQHSKTNPRILSDKPSCRDGAKGRYRQAWPAKRTAPGEVNNLEALLAEDGVKHYGGLMSRSMVACASDASSCQSHATFSVPHVPLQWLPALPVLLCLSSSAPYDLPETSAQRVGWPLIGQDGLERTSRHLGTGSQTRTHRRLHPVPIGRPCPLPSSQHPGRTLAMAAYPDIKTSSIGALESSSKAPSSQSGHASLGLLVISTSTSDCAQLPQMRGRRKPCAHRGSSRDSPA